MQLNTGSHNMTDRSDTFCLSRSTYHFPVFSHTNGTLEYDAIVLIYTGEREFK